MRLARPQSGRARAGLAETSAIYVVGGVLQRGLGFLILPAITRTLPPEEFGLAGTAVAIGTLVAVVCGFGLSLTITRFYYDEPVERSTVWASLIAIQAIISGVLVVALAATGPGWASLIGGLGWSPTLMAALVFGWLTGLQTSLLGLLRAAQRPIAFVVLTVAQVTVGGACGVWWAHLWGSEGYIAGLAAGVSITVVGGLALMMRRPRWSGPDILQGVRMSLPAMLHQVSAWGLDLADRLLVVGFLSLAAVAEYQIAYTAGAALMMLITSAQMAWSPVYMRRSASSREALPSAINREVNLLAICGIAAVVACAPLILAILAPRSYGANEVVLALVAVACAPRAVYFVAVVALVDQRRTGMMATASGAGLVVNLLLNVTLLPTVGLTGAGIAYLASMIVTALLVLRSTGRLLGRSMGLMACLAVWVASAAALVGLTSIGSVGVRVLLSVAALAAAGAVGVRVLHRLRTVLIAYP